MLRKRSVTIELRLRAEAEAVKQAKVRFQADVMRFLIGTLFIGGILFGASTNTMAGAESFIPEIQGGAKELDHLIRTRDFVAVIW